MSVRDELEKKEQAERYLAGMSKHTCGECEHKKGCHLFKAIATFGVCGQECPARTSERQKDAALAEEKEINQEALNKMAEVFKAELDQKDEEIKRLRDGLEEMIDYDYDHKESGCFNKEMLVATAYRILNSKPKE